MNGTDILEPLNKVFHDVFDDDDIVVSPGTTAQDINGWDSLAHIRLMLSVERQFKVKFSAAEVSSLKCVGDLVELIASKR